MPQDGCLLHCDAVQIATKCTEVPGEATKQVIKVDEHKIVSHLKRLSVFKAKLIN